VKGEKKKRKGNKEEKRKEKTNEKERKGKKRKEKKRKEKKRKEKKKHFPLKLLRPACLIRETAIVIKTEWNIERHLYSHHLLLINTVMLNFTIGQSS
jgi:F0F1-type ATP synthase assembly protein I